MKSHLYLTLGLLAVPALAQPQFAQTQFAPPQLAPPQPTPPQSAPSQLMVAQDDALEPPAQYVLQINGKPWPLILDKEISLDRKAGRTRYMLSRGATRHFDKSGVHFDYPTDYGFEADLSDPKIAIWTLSGRNALMMLQRVPLAGPALLRERMARALSAQYGVKNVVSKPTSMLFGGRVLEGKRLQVSLAKQRLVQEIFAFSNPKYAFVLVVQDVPQNGHETNETRDLKAMLGGSSGF